MSARRPIEQDYDDTVAQDSTAIDAARREVEAARATAFAAPPPEAFTGYEILHELHRGGQGVVYQAVQIATQRTVAIKVMREGPFASPAEQARFEREIQILAQLNHPNIVAIHDSGQVAGCQYFVMDYIDGQSLDEWSAGPVDSATRPGERPISDVLRVFQQICAAVNAAHLRGIIHRDLKPGNIRSDVQREPHILDFGLAKVATSGTDSSTMTLTGQFIGSLPWASPEQAEGAPGKIDVRTDVYSLGVILYHMLTGRFPYDVVGNMHDVFERIMSAAPTRPSTIRAQINDEVETIVLKCLSKERERRYQSAGELARDVERYLSGAPIEAKRDSAWYVIRKLLRRYRWPASIAAAFLLLGFGSGVVMTAKYQQAAAAAESARKDAQRARENLALVADVADIPAEERFAQGDPDKRYFLIGPKPSAIRPPEGFRLVIVLPGGDGSADFRPFVTRICKHALSDDYVVAELVAKSWAEDQFEQLVWPTRTSPWPGMKFSTEEFVARVIVDVAGQYPLDRRYVFILGWSSGGPPCYAVTLQEPKVVTGALIAMSMFRPEQLPPLEYARGGAYVLMHSPDDALVPINSANRAHDALRENGATVELITYAGGHGWHGDVYADLRRAFNWLEKACTPRP